MVEVNFEGLERPILAVVDTAAQISMVRNGLLADKGTQEFSVNTAAENKSMACKLLPNVKFSIAGQQFRHSFASGPICDDCILGLDFMLGCNAIVDLPMSMLILKGTAVDVFVQRNRNGEDFQISRVAVAASTRLPAGTRALVEVAFDNQAKVPFVTNPRTTDEYVLGSFILNGESNGFVEIINDSNIDITLKKGQHITTAVELKDVLCPDPFTPTTSCSHYDLKTPLCTLSPSPSPQGAVGLRPTPSPSQGDAGLPSISFSSQGAEGLPSASFPFQGAAGLPPVHFPFQGAEELPPVPIPLQGAERLPPIQIPSQGAAWLPPYPQGATGPPLTPLVRVISDDPVPACPNILEQGPTRCRPDPLPLLSDSALASELPDWRVVDEVNDTGPTYYRTFLPPTTIPIEELRDLHRCALDEVPAHLQPVLMDASSRISVREQVALARLLTVYGDAFSQDKTDLGIFSLLTHRIRTYNEEPVKERLRRTPLKFQKEEEKTLNDMLKSGVIEPSFSEWASAPVLVRKKDGEVRYTVDFRQLNTKTVKDAYPLPLIDECTDTLAGNLWFHTLDLESGYWQIAVHPNDRHKTAFLTKYGLFQHVRMAQGLCNAPATFQRVMHLVLRGLTWNKALVYLDDIIILGRTFEESLENLELVLQRIRAHNLKLKPKKCQLFSTSVHFLGRTVSRDGVAMTNDHIKCVLDWPSPRDQHELEKFLGFINYHRDFLPGLSGLLSPLYALINKNTTYVWSRECEETFLELKRIVTTAPVLAYPNDNDVYILDTDASDTAIGAALYQVQQDQERPISFASSSLTPAQRKYCTTRKELLAVVVFTRRFRHYLLGRHFTVRTDHGSLTWLCR